MDTKMTFEPFNDFRKMALLTAGTPDDYNTMTIAWGALGTIWSKPACTVYVRPSRYTLEFLNKNDYFTVSFFDTNQKDLGYLGRVSGRDEDKVAATSLTPVPAGEAGVTFAEAYRTLVCKKRYKQLMDGDAFPTDVIDAFYSGEDTGNVHYLFIGEVVDVL